MCTWRFSYKDVHWSIHCGVEKLEPASMSSSKEFVEQIMEHLFDVILCIHNTCIIDGHAKMFMIGCQVKQNRLQQLYNMSLFFMIIKKPWKNINENANSGYLYVTRLWIIFSFLLFCSSGLLNFYAMNIHYLCPHSLSLPNPQK